MVFNKNIFVLVYRFKKKSQVFGLLLKCIPTICLQDLERLINI